MMIEEHRKKILREKYREENVNQW